MPQYLLLLRDADSGSAQMAPEELQAVFKRFAEWMDGVKDSGKLRAGEKVKDAEGRVIRRAESQVTIDGSPLMAGGETVSGFFMVQSANYDEAVALASTCPQLEFGSVEVREIEET